MNVPNLSIVITSFNCWHYLDNCLQSIRASDRFIYEIIVVDNASTDRTPEKLQTVYPQVRLVQNSKNLGHTLAVNQGFKKASGSRILLLDADTELELDAIKIMSTFLDEHPEVCVVAPRTLNSDGTIQETARNFPSAMNGLFGRQSTMTRLFPNNPFSKRYLARDNSGGEQPFAVQQVSAACMLFNKSVLDKVGMWDQGYRGYWVDTDWCKRIEKWGGVIYCVPQAVVIHHEQNSHFRKKSPARIINFHLGAHRLYRLHYTRGIWDPRSIIAAALLTLRTILLLITNTFKKNPEP
ncbi:MAG: glycosyltransferase family 2 protein [Planctomycetota bacterium]|jgi:GT2 family glycosyltransferase